VKPVLPLDVRVGRVYDEPAPNTDDFGRAEPSDPCDITGNLQRAKGDPFGQTRHRFDA
jgi:hypothetical protein